MGITVPREMAFGVTFEFCCTLSADCVHASRLFHFLVVSLFVISLSIGVITGTLRERLLRLSVAGRLVLASHLTRVVL